MDIKRFYTLTPQSFRTLARLAIELRKRLNRVEQTQRAHRPQNGEDLITGVASEEIPPATRDDDGCVVPSYGKIKILKLDTSGTDHKFCELPAERCEREVANWGCCPIPKDALVTAHRVFNSCAHFKIIDYSICDSGCCVPGNIVEGMVTTAADDGQEGEVDVDGSALTFLNDTGETLEIGETVDLIVDPCCKLTAFGTSDCVTEWFCCERSTERCSIDGLSVDQCVSAGGTVITETESQCLEVAEGQGLPADKLFETLPECEAGCLKECCISGCEEVDCDDPDVIKLPCDCEYVELCGVTPGFTQDTSDLIAVSTVRGVGATTSRDVNQCVLDGATINQKFDFNFQSHLTDSAPVGTNYSTNSFWNLSFLCLLNPSAIVLRTGIRLSTSMFVRHFSNNLYSRGIQFNWDSPSQGGALSFEEGCNLSPTFSILDLASLNPIPYAPPSTIPIPGSTASTYAFNMQESVSPTGFLNNPLPPNPAHPFVQDLTAKIYHTANLTLRRDPTTENCPNKIDIESTISIEFSGNTYIYNSSGAPAIDQTSTHTYTETNLTTCNVSTECNNLSTLEVQVRNLANPMVVDPAMGYHNETSSAESSINGLDGTKTEPRCRQD